MAVYIITLICVLVYYFYIKIKSSYAYWESRKIKGPKPQYLFGNFRAVITKKESVTTLAANIYKQFSTEQVIGIYQGWKPALIVNDPELINKVLVKHFETFSSRGIRTSENNPLSKNLFALDGEEWKVLRQKLSPVFTPGKLKQMMPLMDNCVKQYLDYLDKLLERPDPLEMRSLKMKYTLKSITTIAFGLDIDTFSEDDCMFIEMANRLFRPQNSKIIIRGLLPGLLKKLVKIDFESPELINFFLDLVSEIANERERKPKVRKDFMDFMIDLKEQETVTKSNAEGTAVLEITDALIAAQAMVYYAAGFESSSGQRFAKVQSMLGLAHFIRKIRVEPCERTTREIKFDPQKMMLTAIDGIWLTLKQRFDKP
ncbi:cytochrome P450 6B7-like [Hyposmocoma kahamanoa]|uniref:cytochrome P450 6B7-like n=1 Tax=Hyposmocoma kahamanoa TaxID=1477025 RepID=UPI000E6D687C|nr:cytochrome P450 6B7-like [Hyposmocoma kahamanoa]